MLPVRLFAVIRPSQILSVCLLSAARDIPIGAKLRIRRRRRSSRDSGCAHPNCLSLPTRGGRQAGAVGCGLVGLGGGRKNGNDEDKSGERKRGLWLRASWEVVEHVMAGLLPSPPSFFSISFSRLVKNFTKRNFIFPFHPSPVFRFAAAPHPPLPRYKRYVPHNFFLLSLEK